MRWFWIDRFLEFVSGSHAEAVKSISLSEDHLHEHFPLQPTMPNSLIVEGIAQTSGLLVSEHFRFSELVVLAKLARAQFHQSVGPGQLLKYRAQIDSINNNGAIISGTAAIEGQQIAEIDLVFARLNPDDEVAGGIRLFRGRDLKYWLHIVGVFDIGKRPDGTPLRAEDYEFDDTLQVAE